MGRHNAIVASQTTLAKVAHCSLPTLKRALSILREQGWIEVRQIGPTGTACAYVINDRVAWTGKRDGISYRLFSAEIGRAHVCTTVTNAHRVCRLLLEQKKNR